MILSCPKCKKQFVLSNKCFNSKGRIDLLDEYIACRQCDYLLPPLQFVGQIRSGELLEWVNAWNKSLVTLNQIQRERAKKPKALWDVVVADSALRKILIGEEKLAETAPSPSLRFVVRSVEHPGRDFILGKFKEHLNEIYQYGYIDPLIQCTCMCIAADGKFFDI